MRLLSLFLLWSLTCSSSSFALRTPLHLQDILNQQRGRKQQRNPLTSLSAADLTQDILATGLCTGLATGLIAIFTKLAKDEIIDPKLCRKLIHTVSAPAFIVVLPLFSSADLETRITASFLPALQFIRLGLSGLKKKKAISSDMNGTIGDIDTKSDFNLADAVSRSGNREEALGGPMIYVTVLFISLLAFFRDSPIGVVAIAQMAVGDGLADIFGRKFGKVNKWFFDKNKSYAGTIAFITGAFLASCALLQWLVFTGCLSFDVVGHLGQLLLISVLCALIELVPGLDDNITVPVSAAILSYFLLR